LLGLDDLNQFFKLRLVAVNNIGLGPVELCSQLSQCRLVHRQQSVLFILEISDGCFVLVALSVIEHGVAKLAFNGL